MQTAIKKTTLTDEVFDILKDRILKGHYQSGDRLKQEYLCRELGVSSSPVREALNKLENDGWIQNIPHKGRVVKQLDEKEVEETYSVRAALECLAVEQAMEFVTSKDLQNLKKMCEVIEEAAESKDIDSLIDTEMAFHSELVRLSGNSILIDIFNKLIQRGKAFLTNTERMNDRSWHDNMLHSRHMHASIIAALEKKDIDNVCELVKTHILFRNYNKGKEK